MPIESELHRNLEHNHRTGTGLYPKHFQWLLENDLDPAQDGDLPLITGCFEIIGENFLGKYGFADYMLARIAERYPVLLHGASLSLGSGELPDLSYLDELQNFIERVSPPWISDHICMTGVTSGNTHELVPIAYNEETFINMIRSIEIVQSYLNCPLALENPETHLQFGRDDFGEVEFINNLQRETDCRILLNIDSLLTSSSIHKFDPVEYIKALYHDGIVQIHMSAFTDRSSGASVISDQALELYRLAQSLAPEALTILEWKDNIPDFPEVIHTLDRLD